MTAKHNPPTPARRDQVLKMIRLGMRETEAADRLVTDIDPTDDFDRAKAERDAAFNNATPEERRLAYEALRRHGY
jgi:hypothetical protein